MCKTLFNPKSSQMHLFTYASWLIRGPAVYPNVDRRVIGQFHDITISVSVLVRTRPYTRRRLPCYALDNTSWFYCRLTILNSHWLGWRMLGRFSSGHRLDLFELHVKTFWQADSTRPIDTLVWRCWARCCPAIISLRLYSHRLLRV